MEGSSILSLWQQKSYLIDRDSTDFAAVTQTVKLDILKNSEELLALFTSQQITKRDLTTVGSHEVLKYG